MQYKEVHLRNIPTEKYNEINKLRKIFKLTWGEVFTKILSKKEHFLSMLATGKDTSLCERQSIATVSMLLPLWCDNLLHNCEYIDKYGIATRMICDCHPKCEKLEKLRELVHSPEVFEAEQVAKDCNIPQELIEKSQQLLLTKGVNYAGTLACAGCTHAVRANKPALIIGNGPSLDIYNHLDLLKEHGFNGDIFCVTAALKKVLDKGIIPKYIGSLDAEENDTKFIDYPIVDEHSDKMTGLFGTTIHPTTNHRFKGNRLFYSGYIGESDVPNISHMFHLITKAPAINTCGNVGTSLWSLAVFMGYNPIIMIGMDLSWPTFEEMKKYHPKVDPKAWFDEDKKPKFKRWYNPVWKKQYYTDPVFESYKVSTIGWISELGKMGVKTYNCTEQGSIHGKNINCMKFEDYLKEQEKYKV